MGSKGTEKTEVRGQVVDKINRSLGSRAGDGPLYVERIHRGLPVETSVVAAKSSADFFAKTFSYFFRTFWNTDRVSKCPIVINGV